MMNRKHPEQAVVKSHDNGVSTWYVVELACGHNRTINWTVRRGWKVPCLNCPATLSSATLAIGPL